VRNLFRRIRVTNKRKSTGLYMLELLIAIATSSALAAALVSNLAETQRFSTAGQENVMAFAVAQEIIDMTRNMPFGSLGDDLGPKTYNFVINRLSPADPTGDPPFNNALLVDKTDPNHRWSEAAEANLFDATASLTVTPLEFANGQAITKQLKVLIKWPANAESQHKYELYTVVSQNGIHN
jgi:type II secretory pathway pseudopilin PulG